MLEDLGVDWKWNGTYRSRVGMVWIYLAQNKIQSGPFWTH